MTINGRDELTSLDQIVAEGPKSQDEAFLETMGEYIEERIGERLDPLRKQIVEQQARIEELEARPKVEYRNVWKSDQEYDHGDLVTDHGALWHCNAPTKDRPGSSKNWTLAEKSHFSRRR